MSKSKGTFFNVCTSCNFDVHTKESVRIDCIYPMNREKTKWNCYCNPTLGGCGRIVYADSLLALSNKWNSGIISEVIQ